MSFFILYEAGYVCFLAHQDNYRVKRFADLPLQEGLKIFFFTWAHIHFCPPCMCKENIFLFFPVLFAISIHSYVLCLS